MFCKRVQVMLQQMYQSIPDIAASATANDCLNGSYDAVEEQPTACVLQTSNVRGDCGVVPVCGRCLCMFIGVTFSDSSGKLQ